MNINVAARSDKFRLPAAMRCWDSCKFRLLQIACAHKIQIAGVTLRWQRFELSRLASVVGICGRGGLRFGHVTHSRGSDSDVTKQAAARHKFKHKMQRATWNQNGIELERTRLVFPVVPLPFPFSQCSPVPVS